MPSPTPLLSRPLDQVTQSRLHTLFVEALAKHLPPSASTLTLLDVGDTVSGLVELRPDVARSVITPTAFVDKNIADAVVTVRENALTPELLRLAWDALRPGGRLIVIDPIADPSAEWVTQLEAAGLTRILVETAVECPLPTGVLIRGEKPHRTDDTLARIDVVAAQEREATSWSAFRGRYAHVLVAQTPNKPVWALAPDELITWRGVLAVRAEQPARLLVFSSLPNAVHFMQRAVLAGAVQGVNKVAKFNIEIAREWLSPILLNPAFEALQVESATFQAALPLEPTTAVLGEE